MRLNTMETKEVAGAEDIVIVGAGIAGLATALGLHKKGVRSLVLESSPELRASGFAFGTWKNAFRALDALGIGDRIRKEHMQAQARDLLLQALEEELPRGTIRYSSKIVSVAEEDGNVKALQLADGSILRAKLKVAQKEQKEKTHVQVLIGCDGINSVVAKWLGLAKPSYSGRSAARGFAHYPDGHGFGPNILQFNGHGFRSGMMPCNERDVYWFFTFSPSEKDNGVDESAARMKQFVVSNLRGLKVPSEVLAAVEKSQMSDVLLAPLRFRPPLSLVTASISRGCVCVAGDALHPMTPDLAQGGCAALEDGVILARCLGETTIINGGIESKRVEAGLREYARIRRWRSFDLIATAYVVGLVQQSDNAFVSFLRDRVLSGALARRLLRLADYDCGTL
ncbi:hypothetical protein PR202_ga30743 [Eleusine coracana subsp. coracana]|uniref:FAD-binding domain-containing protein n=1 Tax=Eleusine coracana subsp. coracana TaxID=191504 RepID=A0AAV5DN69_ELECO|nr:hypothetical protein PR202_ga30743 [Eleusine coracana subsp. coracana]